MRHSLAEVPVPGRAPQQAVAGANPILWRVREQGDASSHPTPGASPTSGACGGASACRSAASTHPRGGSAPRGGHPHPAVAG